MSSLDFEILGFSTNKKNCLRQLKITVALIGVLIVALIASAYSAYNGSREAFSMFCLGINTWNLVTALIELFSIVGDYNLNKDVLAALMKHDNEQKINKIVPINFRK